MIFAQSAKEPHEPQPRTARTATANRTNRSREPHEPQPRTAQTTAANRMNRDRTACVKLLLGSTVWNSLSIDLRKKPNLYSFRNLSHILTSRWLGLD